MLQPDHKRGGSRTPITRTIALSLEGRAHAALGQVSEAAQQLEAAAEHAHCYGLWLLEAFALRDLKLCVLDSMGHGEHGARRLGAVLRLLTGPAELLTPMLKGLDAAKLMVLPEPDPEHEVVYVVEDASTLKLRGELQALKVMALQKRLIAEGVSAEVIEDVMESDQPKKQLVTLLLNCLGPTMAAEHEKRQQLREELGRLRVMALQTRAVDVGIDPYRVEDAMEADNPKSALIELILLQPMSNPKGGAVIAYSPHAKNFQLTGSSEPQKVPEGVPKGHGAPHI